MFFSIDTFALCVLTVARLIQFPMNPIYPLLAVVEGSEETETWRWLKRWGWRRDGDGAIVR